MNNNNAARQTAKRAASYGASNFQLDSHDNN